MQSHLWEDGPSSMSSTTSCSEKRLQPGKLIDFVENSGDIARLRVAFDAFFQACPNTVCDITSHPHQENVILLGIVTGNPRVFQGNLYLHPPQGYRFQRVRVRVFKTWGYSDPFTGIFPKPTDKPRKCSVSVN